MENDAASWVSPRSSEAGVTEKPPMTTEAPIGAGAADQSPEASQVPTDEELAADHDAVIGDQAAASNTNKTTLLAGDWSVLPTLRYTVTNISVWPTSTNRALNFSIFESEAMNVSNTESNGTNNASTTVNRERGTSATTMQDAVTLRPANHSMAPEPNHDTSSGALQTTLSLPEATAAGITAPSATTFTGGSKNQTENPRGAIQTLIVPGMTTYAPKLGDQSENETAATAFSGANLGRVPTTVPVQRGDYTKREVAPPTSTATPVPASKQVTQGATPAPLPGPSRIMVTTPRPQFFTTVFPIVNPGNVRASGEENQNDQFASSTPKNVATPRLPRLEPQDFQRTAKGSAVISSPMQVLAAVLTALILQRLLLRR